MKVAAHKLRLQDKAKYVSIAFTVQEHFFDNGQTEVEVNYSAYTPHIGTNAGPTLELVIEKALAKCSPASMRERASALRKEADRLEALATNSVPV